MPPDKLVMPGLVPGIHVLRAAGKAWMAGSSPAMTLWRHWIPHGSVKNSTQFGFLPVG